MFGPGLEGQQGLGATVANPIQILTTFQNLRNKAQAAQKEIAAKQAAAVTPEQPQDRIVPPQLPPTVITEHAPPVVMDGRAPGSTTIVVPGSSGSGPVQQAGFGNINPLLLVGLGVGLFLMTQKRR